MPTPSATAPAKGRETSSRSFSNNVSGLLDTRRLFELAGFLLSVAGLLLLLSLGTYHPLDPSFNSASGAAGPAHNWIGPVGAYTADLLLQALGWVAFLLPLICFIVGVRLLRGRAFEAPRAKAVGTVLFVASLASLLELFPYTPRIADLIRGSGLLGYFLAAGLTHVLNKVGAAIVVLALFFTSLFLVTRFSFRWAAGFLKVAAALLKAARARFGAYLEARRKARLAQQVARERVLGKQPVVVQRISAKPVAQPSKPPAATPEPKLEEPLRGRPYTSVLPRARTAVEGSTTREPDRAPALAAATAPPAPRIVGRGPQTYKLPASTLLRPPEDQQMFNEDELKERAATLTRKFAEFGVTGAVTQIHPGPVVTTYEFKPEAGIKYSRITNLVDDLCLAMKAEAILIERIAGKSTVGIEVPNQHREIIHLREMIESPEFAASASRLTLCLGKDIHGKNRIADLGQMPHLLIAGSTGAGKSVAINSMIVSTLYKSTPEEVKLILIDPKRLELGLYEGVPHLFTPIVTEPKQAANVLRRATIEMEQRLKRLAEHGVRNIEQYNKLFEPETTPSLFDSSGKEERPLPYIVIVIDELADLMMVEPQGVEESITRLAQMARAVGIHLILATQRPSVDVITGLIKANMPSRVSFRVASKVDSRTILDANGAEALLGKGDMLFMPPGSSRLVRLHGPLVTEKEIGKVVGWWKSQSAPQYNEEFLKPFRDKDRGAEALDEEEDSSELDEVYEEAVRLVVESGKASTSLLQRRLRLGYGRAARLIDMMEKDGIVSAPDGSKPREVLKKPDWLREVDASLR